MPYVPSWERRAKQEGIKEGKLDTAGELIKRGISTDIITESTRLPIEEKEKLAVEI